MEDRRRLNQFKHVKETIANGVVKKTFKSTMKALVKAGRIMPDVSPERYTAMVWSMVRGNTVDGDVIWH